MRLHRHAGLSPLLVSACLQHLIRRADALERLLHYAPDIIELGSSKFFTRLELVGFGKHRHQRITLVAQLLRRKGNISKLFARHRGRRRSAVKRKCQIYEQTQ